MIAILNDTTTLVKAPSKIIVANDEDLGANSHFAVPIGGSGDESAFLEEESSGRKTRKSENTFSPAVITQGVSPVTSVYSNSTDTGAGGTTPCDNTVPGMAPASSQHILHHIPDLSFMLESKLSLPTAKN